MGLSVTVLGASGSYPGPGAACSGYLVRTPAATVWLDAGSGTMAELQQHTSLDDVTAVVLSHAHMDHWSDIEGFSVALAYGLHKSGVPVYAPADLADAVDRESFVWRRIDDGDTACIGDQTWTFSRTDHPVETYAARVEAGGRSLVYSADTGPGWSITTFGEGPDLALMEATYLAHQEGSAGGGAVHLSAMQAGLDARRAGAKAVLLTHVWPANDREATRREGSEAFGAPVDVAVQGRTYRVGG